MVNLQEITYARMITSERWKMAYTNEPEITYAHIFNSIFF
jgi:hypothetical protein